MEMNEWEGRVTAALLELQGQQMAHMLGLAALLSASAAAQAAAQNFVLDLESQLDDYQRAGREPPPWLGAAAHTLSTVLRSAGTLQSAPDRVAEADALMKQLLLKPLRPSP